MKLSLKFVKQLVAKKLFQSRRWSTIRCFLCDHEEVLFLVRLSVRHLVDWTERLPLLLEGHGIEMMKVLPLFSVSSCWPIHLGTSVLVGIGMHVWWKCAFSGGLDGQTRDDTAHLKIHAKCANKCNALQWPVRIEKLTLYIRLLMRLHMSYKLVLVFVPE